MLNVIFWHKAAPITLLLALWNRFCRDLNPALKCLVLKYPCPEPVYLEASSIYLIRLKHYLKQNLQGLAVAQITEFS